MTGSRPECVLVPGSPRYVGKGIDAIRFEDGDLILDVSGDTFGRAQVVFRSPIGFRVLDERELTEFWNTYSEPHGWLWEVLSGGWLELEKARSTFNVLDLSLREFFVVDQFCVSVWCREPPEFVDVTPA